MDSDDREHVSVVINYLWGEGTVQAHSVNENAAAVVYEALEEAQACSASMDLVPRPAYGRPGMRYIVKEVVKIGARIESGDTDIYEACRKQIASRFRIKIDMALQGL